ncbi:MAG TPA: hypothetical protein DDY32_17930 [Desulfobulbaceae bacterium]|nr:hypothetical protein [Desulfobulbaceae bacterium]
MWAAMSPVGFEWTETVMNMAQAMNTYRKDKKKTFFGIVLLVGCKVLWMEANIPNLPVAENKKPAATVLDMKDGPHPGWVFSRKGVTGDSRQCSRSRPEKLVLPCMTTASINVWPETCGTKRRLFIDRSFPPSVIYSVCQR